MTHLSTAQKYADLAAQGYSKAMTAEILGVSREAVGQAARRYGIAFHSGHADEDLRDAIADLHAKGMTDTEMAIALGRQACVIRVARISIGLPRNRKRPSSKYEAELLRLSAAGYTTGEAAAEIGIPKAHVSVIAKRLGVVLTDGRTKRWQK